MSGSALVTRGGSLTSVIVTMNVSLMVFRPEIAVTVIKAVPNCRSWKSRVSVSPVMLVLTNEGLLFWVTP